MTYRSIDMESETKLIGWKPSELKDYLNTKNRGTWWSPEMVEENNEDHWGRCKNVLRDEIYKDIVFRNNRVLPSCGFCGLYSYYHISNYSYEWKGKK